MIKGLWKIIVLSITKPLVPCLSLFITIFWALIRWFFHREQPLLSTLFGQPELIFRFIVLFVTIICGFGFLFYTLSKIPALNEKLEKLEKTSFNILMKAVGVVGDLAGGKFIDKEIVEKKRTLVGEGLESLKFNIASWGDLINFKSNDDLLKELWLSYFATYFREEAFDIKRKELVTNGRNYPFLLIETLLTFLNSIENQGNKKILFYSTTPVHPKDWFNWPYGNEKPRAYFEVDFMRLYRGLLKKILSSKHGKQIVRKCFVLFAKGQNAYNTFNWPLDDKDSIEDIKLRDWVLLDFPVLLTDLKNRMPRLGSVYEKMLGQWSKQYNKVVPMYCKNTKIINKIEKLKFKPSFNFTDDYKNCIEEAPNHSEISKLIADSKRLFTKELRTNVRNLFNFNAAENSFFSDEEKKCLSKVLKCVIEGDLKWDQLLDQSKCNSWIDANINESILLSKVNSMDFLSYCKDIQKLSVLLPKKHKDILKILINLLCLSSLSIAKGFKSLFKLYVEDLHSNTADAQYLILEEDHAKRWKDMNIPPEFAAFGIEETKNGSTEKIWKLIMLTDINYPFETVKIEFITEKDEKWTCFKKILHELDADSSIYFYKKGVIK